MKQRFLILGALGVLGIMLTKSVLKTRGFRNNNPGNIRQTDIFWKGESTDDFDPEFEEFTSMEKGIRAIGVLLSTYQRKYNLNSIREIISRYAPPRGKTGEIENDTDAYIRSVSDYMSTDPGTPLVLTNVQTKALLVAAIIKHENGYQPFNQDFIIYSITS